MLPWTVHLVKRRGKLYLVGEASCSFNFHVSPNQGLNKHQEVCFTPVTKVKKKYCDFQGPSWCNIKVDPERYFPCGSYKPLVSYVAHQMKHNKIRFENLFFSFLREGVKNLGS